MKIKIFFRDASIAFSIAGILFLALMALGPKVATVQAAQLKALKKVKAGSITNPYLGFHAVTAEKIDGGAVGSYEIGDATIKDVDIASDAGISTGKIGFSGSDLDFNSLDLAGHMAVGSGASVNSSRGLNIEETITNQSSANYGLYVRPVFNYSLEGAGGKYDYGVYVAALADDVVEGSGNYYLKGISSNATITSGSTANIVSALEADTAVLNALGTTVDNAYGIQTEIQGNGSGTVSDAKGISSYVSTSSSNATFTTAYGIYGKVYEDLGAIETGYGAHLTCTGGVSTCYGLRMVLGGADVVDWGIYETGADKNYFSGNVGIGTTAPDAKLEVDGVIKTKERSSATCNAAAEGGIYYDSDDSHFYGCNGSSWIRLDYNP